CGTKAMCPTSCGLGISASEGRKGPRATPCRCKTWRCRVASPVGAVLWSRAMDTPSPQTADPFSEPGFRDRARKGLLAQPSQAIFDPRSGRALGPSDWDLSPEFLGDLAVMAPPRPAAVLVPIVLRETL